MRIYCSCGGAFVCAGCDHVLRKTPTDEAAPDNFAVEPWPLPEKLRRFLAGSEADKGYASAFQRGARGGAMIDFGDLVSLECFFPYIDEGSGEDLPFLPMPLVGDVIHDLVRSDRESCERGGCLCEHPVGWRLTRPILRRLLGVSDAFLNEHGGQLPGRLPGWRLAVDTLTFMRECYFNPEFQFPTREASRDARKRQQLERRAVTCGRCCSRKPPRPGERKSPRNSGGEGI